VPVLLLRLAGPMQSWGTTSRFADRETQAEPSKSGVLGLLGAAMGIDRGDWEGLEPLTRLSMTVRHDRPGIPARDFQTAGAARNAAIIKADGKLAKDGGVISRRDYLADALFLVCLEGENESLLRRANAALLEPKWPLFLGRKSYVPSEPMSVASGLRGDPAHSVVRSLPWLGTLRRGEQWPERLLVTRESEDRSGSVRMDSPIAAFESRSFGGRWVQSEWIPFPTGTQNAVT
jgi:CRISPR system Cascade subunit CasD